MLRRIFVLAVVTVGSFLIPPPAYATRGGCDQQCRQEITWYWASRLTWQRMWFGSIAARNPHQMCVKNHESSTAGLYRAYDGSGNYGAYQDDRRTWDSVAGRWRPDLVGVNILGAAWWDQEEINWHLYMERGDQPWGNRCR